MAAESVNVATSFLATGDGVTDDTTAFSSAVSTGRPVYVPAGTYRVNLSALPSNTQIHGDGERSILKPFDVNARSVFNCDSGSSSAYVSDLSFRNLKFLGTVATDGFSEQCHLLDLHGVKRLRIDSCFFEGARGDGVYLGGGSSALNERHNVDVSITNCVFDGVNNDNRNGLSVIDVDGMLVSGCTFRNWSRSSMPGSLDFEPNYSFSAIKNVRVVGNRFTNTDGNRGHLCIQTHNTVNVENIYFGQNQFDDVAVNSAAVSMSFSDTTPTTPQRITIEGNQIDVTGSRGIYKLDGATDGIVIRGNVISAITGIWMTYTGAENSNLNITIDGNLIYDEATSSGIVLNDTFTNVSIRGNLFKGTPARHIQLAGTEHAGVSITDNDFVGAASSGVITSSVTTPNTQTNILLGNRFENNALVQFAAARSDYQGHIANPTGADETTTPDAYNPGISRVRLTGKSISGFTLSGILETHAPIGTAYVAHRQFFYPDYSATQRDKVYFRKAVDSANWDGWQALSGVGYVGVSTDKGDASATLTVGTSETTARWATPITADRAATLSTTGATSGSKFRVVRTAAATGAFNLNVGSGPLKALAVGQWCEVEYNGSAWMLTAFGSL